jgi:hypothetical protein
MFGSVPGREDSQRMAVTCLWCSKTGFRLPSGGQYFVSSLFDHYLERNDPFRNY